MAVLFLDTQGLFDLTMTKEENMKLFTFTVLLCSNLILNIKGIINERELESLQFFSEYAKSAAVELGDQAPFQRLMFLLRDWQYLSDHAYGLAGGSEYLSDYLGNDSTISEENTRTRVDLESTFQKLECFLMPRPGDCIEEQKFVGRNKDLDPKFLKHVGELVTTLFHPDNLQAKSYGGRRVTGRSLWKLLQGCNDTFRGGTLPKVENMATAFSKMCSNTAMENALSIVKQSFENEQRECKNLDRNLNEFYEEVTKKALEQFNKEACFGSEEVKSEYRRKLISECQDLFKTCTKFDDLRKIKAHNFSSEKVHEIWSLYVENMKEDIRGTYQTDADLNRMHRTHSANALRSYQEEASIEVAFHEEHFKQLEEGLIVHSFQKFQKVNSERHHLEETGAASEQDDSLRLVYEGTLFLHNVSQQYREELEKFVAVYIEEKSFEEQMTEMHSKYFEIFENNWNRSGAEIYTFRNAFLESLNGEYNDALAMNRRNKKLFESRLEESGMRVKAHYSKIMLGLIERSYVDPETLQKEHENTFNRLLGDLESELDEVAGELKDQVISEIQQDIDKMYERVKEKNRSQRSDKPPLDSKTPFVTIENLLEALKMVPSIIRKYKVLIRLAKDIYVGGKKVVALAATVLPSKETALAALPSAGTVAVAGVVVVGASIVAYGVYRYYNRKQADMIEQ